MSYVTDEWKELITQPVVRMFYLEGNTIQELIPGTKHTSLCGEAIRQFEEENNCRVIAAAGKEHIYAKCIAEHMKAFIMAFVPNDELARVTMALRANQCVVNVDDHKNALRRKLIEKGMLENDAEYFAESNRVMMLESGPMQWIGSYTGLASKI